MPESTDPPAAPTPEQEAAYLEDLDRKIAAMTLPEGCEPLPLDPNYKSVRLRHYRYKGTVINTWHVMAGAPEHWRRFSARPTDVFVASFPKSGTTWLQELVWQVVHQEQSKQTDEPLEYRFPLFDMPSVERMRFKEISEMSDPRLIKTHLPYHLLPESVWTSGAKVLYVSRDPRDVCVSYYHFCRMVNFNSYRGTFAEFRDAFQKGEMMYGPYREHVKGYRDHAGQVLCVTYEELHQDRVGCIKRVAEFLGRPMTDELAQTIFQRTSFAEMKKNPAVNYTHWQKEGVAHPEKEVGAFMRKGKVGDWTNYFTQEEGDALLKWSQQLV
ncbi:Sulfotransferase family cytosolic 1B member 1 [Amphibalanus amphitrite]|uniref:Sulfotransferase family cytosolic 1B member 1 n=1 Tax=Amphibalanus amphitrite TaxID=1232801 RepID=A0A6A4X8B9_AMPAM|nr:sulfotransferase family cytosolic 1B member 1-like [Amphibalanus amphitrite]KAF0311268.1 Sulfotransferase family cytosolic 1B member 1 [Amphibalanus amphitrite]